MLSIRFIEPSDKLYIYDWANDPITRRNSFNSQVIVFNDHCKWFDSVLSSKMKLYLMCLWNKERAGIVRFDMFHHYSLIGININPVFRGKGLSVKFLEAAIYEYFKLCSLPIKARIKHDNTASLKAFKRAGFEYIGDEVIANDNAMVLVLPKVDI